LTDSSVVFKLLELTTKIEVIPDKEYFKIGEVAGLLNVESHVIRYWEENFSIIRPYITKSKYRLFRKKDVITLLQLKVLIKERKFTLKGAKQIIRKYRQLPQSANLQKNAAKIIPRDLHSNEFEYLKEIRDNLIKLKTKILTIKEKIST